MVRFVPLGGLGEVGMNCFALESGQEIIVVDCGMGFPEDDVGVDVLHPDFSWLFQNQERITGIFITHGHEDHIGALPYLVRGLKKVPPIYAPAHALVLIRQRFAEHDLDDDMLVEAKVGSRTMVGSVIVESIAVAHSIIDATALCFETPVGRIIHTGDFDLDETQPAGHLCDETRFRELGDLGVRLLLSDSTNIDSEVRRGSEREVGLALERVVSECPKRAIVALFSSNVHRLQMLFDIARETDRRVCLLGRSLSKHFEAARMLGRLPRTESLLVAAEQARNIPAEQLLVLAGGSQGEAASALRRLSLDSHQHLRLSADDAVIFSSRVIPGNERAVFQMTNDFLRLGVHVRSKFTDPDLHTSGHAGRSEQTKMIEWVRPQSFIPVHGTLHHLLRHEELARQLGVDDTVVVEDGYPVAVTSDGPLQKQRPVPHGVVAIALGGEELDAETRRRRHDLSRNGVAVVAVGLGKKGRIVFGPTFSSYGIPSVDRDASAIRAIGREVSRLIDEHRERAPLPIDETIRRGVRRLLQDWTGTRPVIEVHIERVEGA